MHLPIKYMDGTGDQSLMFIHGLGANYQSWKNVREHIDNSFFRIYMPDLLGFGDAPKLNGIEYSLYDHADAIINTIEELGISGVMLVGHSLGALVAVEVAMTRPDLIKHLTLIGAPLFEDIPSNSTKRLLSPLGRYYSLYKFLKSNQDLVISGASIAEDLLPHLHGLEVTKETWNAFEKSLSNSIMQTKSYRDIANLQVPTQFITSRFDPFIDNRSLNKAIKSNKEYAKSIKTFGSHEIDVRRGKLVAKSINKLAKKYSKS